MGFEEKVDLMDKLEGRLCTVLDTETLVVMSKALSEVLERFEVTYLDTDTSTTDECLEAFLNAKSVEGCSEKTIKYYRWVLTKLHEEVACSVQNVSVYHLRNYLSKRKDDGIADKTLEDWRSVYSSYFGWLHKEGLIASNPCANLNTIKCEKKIRLPYSDVDLEKLKESCTLIRDKAMVSILLATGCRISEIVKLNREDVNCEKLECTVYGKGKKERTVYFDEVTAMLLRRYLEERTDESEALFVGKGTERMTPGGIRARLHVIAMRAGVNNCHPHRFRRTLATNLIDRGMPIQEVAEILGHEKLDTTMKYVYTSKSSVRNSYRKYS